MKIQNARPFFPQEDIVKICEDITAVLESGYLLSVKGKYTAKFEQAYADYIGTQYAVTTSTGTSALVAALRCYNLRPDSEVIVPTNTFLASPNSVLFAGGKPVLADISEDSLCIDVDNVEKQISDKTVGVMVVHIAGLVCPQILEIAEVCKDHGLFLMEDAAHAHGAMFRDRKAGSIGDVGIFSFYPTKILTTGEGGIVCTNDPQMVDKIKVLRFDGINKNNLHVELSDNWHITELASVLGLSQLNRLEEFVHKRNEVARLYTDGVKRIDGVHSLPYPPHIRHSYYKFMIRLDESIDTERLRRILQEQYNVETGRLYYPPCHLQPVYRRLYGYKEGMYPVAEKVLKQVICLPTHVKIERDEARYVLESLETAVSES